MHHTYRVSDVEACAGGDVARALCERVCARVRDLNAESKGLKRKARFHAVVVALDRLLTLYALSLSLSSLSQAPASLSPSSSSSASPPLRSLTLAWERKRALSYKA